MNDEPISFHDLMYAMSEHLIELRKRMFIAFGALIVAVIICMLFAEHLMEVLCRPIGGLDSLTAIEVTENVVAVFDVSLLGGFILALPVIAYEALAFIIPALKPNEKNILFSFLPPIVLFFIAGVSFAFFVILPAAIPFLTTFLGIKTEVRPSNYISFSTSMLFWIGVAFEMPMLVYICTRLHLISSSILLKNWRIAVVICAILAMIITPTVDPINMMLLMVPLVGLFFLSILFAKIAEGKFSSSH